MISQHYHYHKPDCELISYFINSLRYKIKVFKMLGLRRLMANLKVEYIQSKITVLVVGWNK